MQQTQCASAAHDQEPRRRSIASMLPPLTAYPACFCVPSTPWEDRRYDGVWEDLYDVLSGEQPGPALESRTCMCCGATKSIEVLT